MHHHTRIAPLLGHANNRTKQKRWYARPVARSSLDRSQCTNPAKFGPMIYVAPCGLIEDHRGMSYFRLRMLPRRNLTSSRSLPLSHPSRVFGGAPSKAIIVCGSPPSGDWRGADIDCPAGLPAGWYPPSFLPRRRHGATVAASVAGN